MRKYYVRYPLNIPHGLKLTQTRQKQKALYYGRLQSALSGAPTAGGAGAAGTPTVKRQPTYSSEEQAAISSE